MVYGESPLINTVRGTVAWAIGSLSSLVASRLAAFSDAYLEVLDLPYTTNMAYYLGMERGSSAILRKCYLYEGR